MDPLFHYLNRIPGVISVQAYVDDTTIAGTAADPRWIYDVAGVYQRNASAGFHIDSHACFRAVVNDDMRFQPRLVTTEELLSYWPTIADSREYGTLQEAVSCNMQPGRCTRVVRLSTATLHLPQEGARQRNYHVCINLSYPQARDVGEGRGYASCYCLELACWKLCMQE